MNGWTEIVVPLGVAAVASGGVISAIVLGWMRRPADKAQATALIVDSAIKQINELQERVTEAEAQAGRATSALINAREQAEGLAQDLYDLRMAIFQPGQTIEGLRHLVNAGRLKGRINGGT